jgi:hypothetical protein
MKGVGMESDLKKELKKLFPLKVTLENTYLGMGEHGIRYKLSTQSGNGICRSDYEPAMINEINFIVGVLLGTIE